MITFPEYDEMIRIEEVRRRGTGGWDWLRLGCIGLFLMSGCEMAGGSSEGIPMEIPGTSVEAPAAAANAPDELPSPVVTPGVEVSESTALAIRDAAVAYVRGETAISDIQVEIDAVADGWARVQTIPAREETDPATLYLRQEENGWRGISLGTVFLPEELDEMGVPAAVRR